MLVRLSGYNYRRLLIMGYNSHALAMAKKIDTTPVLGYKILGFIACSNSDTKTPEFMKSANIIGHISNLKTILERSVRR